MGAVTASADSADAASRYSSLLDIGQAYGIWNPSEDNSNDLESDQKDLKIVEDDDEEASSDDKESEELKVDLKEKDERAKAATPGGLRETSNNNNVSHVSVSAEKSLTAPRVLPMETA